MDYIVFDLEWNQAPAGKESELPLLPFEIIEIGAQKLDSQLKPLGSFHAVIKPVVYQTLHSCIREVVGLTDRDLKKGLSFAEAYRDFKTFCGKDCTFATWGSMDLTELQRNIRFFDQPDFMTKPLFYCDVQKLFSLAFEDGKTRRSLEHAVEALGIPLTDVFHRADSDAMYTARILAQIPLSLIRTHYSVDYYATPDSKKEELHLDYPGYYKYVSRKFESREDAIADKTVTAIRCIHCKKALRKKIRWFSGNNRIYYCLAECPEHGYVKGKIRMKKNDEGRVFVVKTVKMTDAEGAERIRRALEEMRRKRRARGSRTGTEAT